MKQNAIRFARAVAVAAAVGGLARAGSALGLLELDASTAGFVAGVLALVGDYLLALEPKK